MVNPHTKNFGVGVKIKAYIMRNLLFIFIALILIGVILAIFLLTRGDRNIQRIHKNLNTIASLVEKKAQETPLVCIARMQKLTSFFVENCQIDVGSPVPNMTNRNELVGTFSQICQLENSLEVNLSEVSITLESDTLARSSFIATAVISSSLIEKESIYPRQLSLEWEKIEGSWKIKRAKVIEVLH